MPMATLLASLVSYQIVQRNVFTYAGFMVEYLGVVDDKDQAGYYAGLLSSGDMVGRLLSSHIWGLVSDRYGFRFVIVFGLSSMVVLSVAFGVSTSFAWAFTCRFLIGLFNGMMAATKTLVPVLCGREHETVGMGVVTTSLTLGVVLGPGVGGLLAEPANHHPRTFSESGIFGRHPYLLPNLVGAGFSLLTLPLVFTFLQDTQREKGGDSSYPWFRVYSRHDADSGASSSGADTAPTLGITGASSPGIAKAVKPRSAGASSPGFAEAASPGINEASLPETTRSSPSGEIGAPASEVAGFSSSSIIGARTSSEVAGSPSPGAIKASLHGVAGGSSPGAVGAIAWDCWSITPGAIGAVAPEVDRLTPPTSPWVVPAVRELHMTRASTRTKPNTESDCEVEGVHTLSVVEGQPRSKPAAEPLDVARG